LEKNQPNQQLLFLLKESKMEDGGQGFLQDPPRLGNQYSEDTPLREVLQRLLPEDVLQSIEPDLQRFGWRVVEECTLHGTPT
jgi:hypothetical protein